MAAVDDVKPMLAVFPLKFLPGVEYTTALPGIERRIGYVALQLYTILACRVVKPALRNLLKIHIRGGI
jgi:hypothetical protein